MSKGGVVINGNVERGSKNILVFKNKLVFKEFQSVKDKNGKTLIVRQREK